MTVAGEPSGDIVDRAPRPLYAAGGIEAHAAPLAQATGA
jgi:hypothetical protein